MSLIRAVSSAVRESVHISRCVPLIEWIFSTEFSVPHFLSLLEIKNDPSDPPNFFSIMYIGARWEHQRMSSLKERNLNVSWYVRIHNIIYIYIRGMILYMYDDMCVCVCVCVFVCVCVCVFMRDFHRLWELWDPLRSRGRTLTPRVAKSCRIHWSQPSKGKASTCRQAEPGRHIHNEQKQTATQ